MDSSRWKQREFDPLGYIIDYEFDGLDNGKLSRTFWQPHSLEVKLHNKELRKDSQFGADSLVGRWALSMDEIDRYTIGKLFPGINSLDAEERAQEWRRFLRSPLSEPYKVREDKW